MKLQQNSVNGTPNQDNSDFNGIKNNLNTYIIAVHEMISNSKNLNNISDNQSKHEIKGKIKTSYSKLVFGVFDILDSVVGSLCMSVKHLEEINSNSELDTQFNRDFNKIANEMNLLIKVMNQTTNIAEEMSYGKFTTSPTTLSQLNNSDPSSTQKKTIADWESEYDTALQTNLLEQKENYFMLCNPEDFPLLENFEDILKSKTGQMICG